ncbi:lamin tail domain-containing protein [Candidatus Woesearchaeota archaeon]|nr:lamin tail domain-containing protein [Candidatus Woesearchaeota archaeon]
MAANPEYEFKKLNDLLCTSFNNIKYDVRDINGKIENLKTNFASFSTESIKTAFESQTKIISELQNSINQTNERISELERKPEQAPMQIQPVSTVFKTRDSALTEIRNIVREDSKKKTKETPSIYDIPEGQARITSVQFKAKGNGKKNLNSEWVEVTGYGVELTGFKLHDKGRKHTFNFPAGFTAYGPVKIFTGKGRNTNTKLYWGRPKAVWNDKGDVATLRNKQNRIVSQVLSEPTYSFKPLK